MTMVLALSRALTRLAAIAAAEALAVVAAAAGALLGLLVGQRLFGGRQGGGGGGHQAQRLVVTAVEAGDGLAGDPLDVLQQVTLVVGTEADRRTTRAGARRAADAVD